MDCRLLFVYGSLRRGFDLHHHLTRIGARFVAEAKVAAELIERGPYPGALPARRKGRWVRGEIFHLRQPVSHLRVLDQVEEFYPTAPERSLFVRGVADVILTNSRRQSAWIYWLRTKSLGVSHG